LTVSTILLPLLVSLLSDTIYIAGS